MAELKKHKVPGVPNIEITTVVEEDGDTYAVAWVETYEAERKLNCRSVFYARLTHDGVVTLKEIGIVQKRLLASTCMTRTQVDILSETEVDDDWYMTDLSIYYKTLF